MTQRSRTFYLPGLGAVIILVVIAIAASVLLYSTWFRACCMDSARGLLAVILFPAMLSQLVLQKGNIHDGNAVQFTIGLAIELYLSWWLISWIRLRRRKREAR
jgi:hypothetical protein